MMKLQPCERNLSVRRADAEKPGCLIFKNLTKTTSSHSKPKEPSDNFIPHLQLFDRQHIYVYMKANIYVLQSERSPQLTPPLPPCWAGLTVLHGFMAS